MEAALRPYTAYKDSGWEWLGRVPTHWDVLPHRALFHEVEDTGYPDEPLLSVTISRGVIPQEALLAGSSKKDSSNLDKSKYKLVEPGDIAYNKMRAWQGALGVSEHRGIVSPAYIVVRPRQTVAPRFFHYLFRAPAFIREAERWSYGITSDMWSLRYEDFRQIYSVLPPLAEQRQITRYLDEQSRRANRLIRAKQRLIALLNEQKQVIARRATTQGINPDVPLKTSGIDWLGDIPAHWDVQRLKYLADIRTGGRDTVDRVDDGEYPFFVRSQTVERIDTYSFDGEAVLTAGDGAGVAKVFHYVSGKFDYHQRVYKFSDFREVLGKFFYHYVSSNLRYEVLRLSAKSTVDSLRLPMLQNFSVALPPRHEQEQIVAHIEAHTTHLDSAIDRARSEIKLIREYQTRLIADVVTGKLDMRGLALPDHGDTDLMTEMGVVDNEFVTEEEFAYADG